MCRPPPRHPPRARRRFFAPALPRPERSVAPVEHPRLALAGLRDAVALARARARGVRAARSRPRAVGIFAEDEDSTPRPPAARRPTRGSRPRRSPRRCTAAPAALVVPFVLLPALAFARESSDSNRARSQTVANAEVRRLRRLPRRRARRRRRAAQRRRARGRRFFFKTRRTRRRYSYRRRAVHTRTRRYVFRREGTSDATTVAMMIGVLLEVLIDVARIASPARVPPSRRRARNASSRDLSYATIARVRRHRRRKRRARRSSARWRRWRARRGAPAGRTPRGGSSCCGRRTRCLPPPLVLVRVDEWITSRSRVRRNRAGTRFAAAFPRRRRGRRPLVARAGG